MITEKENIEYVLKSQRDLFPGSTFNVYQNSLGHFAILSESQLKLNYWSDFTQLKEVD